MIYVDWTKVFNIFVTVAVCAVLIFLVRLLFVKFQKNSFFLHFFVYIERKKWYHLFCMGVYIVFTALSPIFLL